MGILRNVSSKKTAILDLNFNIDLYAEIDEIFHILTELDEVEKALPTEKCFV